MKIVKRVSSKEFETEVEDKITEGYKISSKTDRQAVLLKRSYGGFLGHIIVFLVFGWWTFLVANLLYAGYCYSTRSNEVILKIKK